MAPVMTVQDLRMRYGRRDPLAVDGVTFELEPGQAFGLLGPNGAGKTTVVKAVSIFSKPVTRLAFATGKVGAAIAGLLIVVGLLAIETRIVMLLFGGGLENALTGEILATVANILVVMLLVLALSTWMNNIVAAVVAFIYSNVVEGIIVFVHRFADQGVIGSDAVRIVFDVLYWLVPHPLVSSAAGDLARAQIQMSSQQVTNQMTASIPPSCGAGDIAWWAVTIVVFCGLLYYSVRRRQV